MEIFIMHRLNKKPLVGVKDNNAASAVAAAMYAAGQIPPRFPVPAVVCKTVSFPEGNPFTEFPGVPYVNWLRYKGDVEHYIPGYYETVQRIFYLKGTHYLINYVEEEEDYGFDCHKS